MMNNPWLDLPETAPFILDCDKQTVLRFDATAKEDYKMHLEVLPEPYTGDVINAKIVLLNLNPGFYERNETFFHDPSYDYFVKAHKANLRHEPQTYPFYHLDPIIAESSGGNWWGKKLRQLIDRYGTQKIAHEICNLEYFPYASKHFGFNKSILESQKYTFYLLEEALKREAIVILMRGRVLWEQAVPSLRGCPYFTLNSSQNASISERNCPTGYAEIVKKLG